MPLAKKDIVVVSLNQNLLDAMEEKILETGHFVQCFNLFVNAISSVREANSVLPFPDLIFVEKRLSSHYSKQIKKLIKYAQVLYFTEAGLAAERVEEKFGCEEPN